MGKMENYFFLKLLQPLVSKLLEAFSNRCMKFSEYQRSGSFFDLGQRSLRFQS